MFNTSTAYKSEKIPLNKLLLLLLLLFGGGDEVTGEWRKLQNE
jgi:hypothetical protein